MFRIGLRAKVNLIYKFWGRKSFLLQDVSINGEIGLATDDASLRKWSEKIIEVSFLEEIRI